MRASICDVISGSVLSFVHMSLKRGVRVEDGDLSHLAGHPEGEGPVRAVIP